MIAFVECRDSFSHLLAGHLAALAGEPLVMLDHLTVPPAFTEGGSPRVDGLPVTGLVLSPGPGRPSTSGHLMGWIAWAHRLGLPMLGVCLGHQALGEFYGTRLETGAAPMQGKISPMVTEPGPMYGTEVSRLKVVRYHSLVLKGVGEGPSPLQAQAWSEDTGEVMAFCHREAPIWGVQYHPEAILTESGPTLLARWLALAGIPGGPLPLAHRIAGMAPGIEPPRQMGSMLFA